MRRGVAPHAALVAAVLAVTPDQVHPHRMAAPVPPQRTAAQVLSYRTAVLVPPHLAVIQVPPHRTAAIVPRNHTPALAHPRRGTDVRPAAHAPARLRPYVPPVAPVAPVPPVPATPPVQTPPVSNRPPTPPADTLDPADPLGGLVAEALARNPLLQAERAAEAGAEAGVRQARAAFLPSLSVESRHSEQDGTLNLGDVVNPAYAVLNELAGTDQFPTDLDLTLPFRHESRIRVAQPVVNFGLRANHAAARHREDAQRWRRLAHARGLAAEVQAAYLAAASARRAAGIHAATLELVREHERVAERLVEAGRSTPDVVFRARADRAEAEQRLLEAREAAAAAERVLNQLVGRPLDAPLDDVPDTLLVRELPLAREAAVEHALAHREELAQLDAAAAAADAGARAAAASSYPSLAVALDYGVQGRRVRFDRESDFLVASLIVSWTLYTGGAAGARVDAARAERSALLARRRDAAEKVRLDVLRAFDAAASAGAAIEAAGHRLEAARRAYALVGRRYEEGVAGHVELTDARTALTSAELNHSVTLYRYATRLVDLERAAALRAID